MLLALPVQGVYNTGMATRTTAKLITAGQKSGRWTALEDQRHTFTEGVLCLCECGTKRTVRTQALSAGRSLSCGCLTKEIAVASGAKRRKHHISPGDVYGRLTVINADRWTAVECRCECGKATVVDAARLYQGTTKSCGCLRIDTITAVGRANSKRGGATTHSLFSAWKDHAHGWRPMHQPWRDSPQLFIQEVEAEIGPRPPGSWFLTRDPDIGAAPGNIYWGDRTSAPSSRTRLNGEQKREIAALVKAGRLGYEVAREYRVSPSTVSSICKDPRYAA